MSKVVCSEAIARVADRSMQILGGMGMTRDTVVERIFRDTRAFRIYDGRRRSIAGRWARGSWPEVVSLAGPRASRPPHESRAGGTPAIRQETRQSQERPQLTADRLEVGLELGPALHRRGDRRTGMVIGAACRPEW